MKLTLSKFFALAALCLPVAALAHPGHSGYASHSILDSLTLPLLAIVLGYALLQGTRMALAHTVLKHRPQLAQRFGQLIAVVGCGLMLSIVL